MNDIVFRNPLVHLWDAVYEILYQKIICLDIEPGASLSDTLLAKELGISRTPIQNALLRLQDDGLVIQTRGHAFCVKALKKAGCQQLMEARMAIEGQAAYLAAERITGKNLSLLQESLDGFEDALRTIMLGSAKHHRASCNALELGFGKIAREQIEQDISGMIVTVGNWKND